MSARSNKSENQYYKYKQTKKIQTYQFFSTEYKINIK